MRAPETAELRAPRFCAVVMDMDGLALDTEAAYCYAWRAAAADQGFDLTAEFCRSLFGQHADDVQRALRETCGNDLDLRRFNASAEDHWYHFLDNHGVAKMPDLDRLLAVLKERCLPYALATNSDAPYALEVLRRASALDQFPVIVTRDEVENGKPAPDLFLEAARRLGVPAGECLGLEDSETGLVACTRAGMIPLWITTAPSGNRFHLKQERIWVLPSLGALADYIERRSPVPARSGASEDIVRLHLG